MAEERNREILPGNVREKKNCGRKEPRGVSDAQQWNLKVIFLSSLFKGCRRQGGIEEKHRNNNYKNFSINQVFLSLTFTKQIAAVHIFKTVDVLCFNLGHGWKNSVIWKDSVLLMIVTGAKNLCKRWLKEIGVFYEKILPFPPKASLSTPKDKFSLLAYWDCWVVIQ